MRRHQWGGTIGRPLEAARCDLLTANVLRDSDPEAAQAAARRSAEDYERLGVAHMFRAYDQIPRRDTMIRSADL